MECKSLSLLRVSKKSHNVKGASLNGPTEFGPVLFTVVGSLEKE